MKKKLLIGKIICFIGILIFTIGISYMFTYYLEKTKYQDIDLLVTFEDTYDFTLENTSFLDEESVLKTYPYIFTVLNNGKSKVNYQIKINDLDTNISREDLDYILYKNDKEIKKGSLDNINDILYTTNIKGKKNDTYKLYIYLNKELDEVNYKYSLEIITGDV